MKNIWLTLMASVFCLTADAQLEKGRIFVGGSLSTEVQTVNTQNTGVLQTKSWNYVLQPKVGIMLSSRTSVGVGFGYSNYYFKTVYTSIPTDAIARHTLTSVAPFFRYYIPITTSVYLTLQTQASFGTGQDSNPILDTSTGIFVAQKSNTTVYGIAETPVFIFFPSSHWSIEAGLGSLAYSYVKAKPVGASGIRQNNSSFAFNAGQISLGIAYYFGTVNPK